MRYEKKMIILTGEGKGVVLIEKSGLGVKFALRTFGLPRRVGLKAGVVTRSCVFVRDLPCADDPSIVFYVDCGDIDGLHFAVFDSEIRLYGTSGKRMWESNLMGLFDKHVRPARPPEPSAPPLPPIAEPPKTLPLPDGTGIVQSRDALYGDEALAENDFYTPLDMSGRMKQVDEFLDTPRVVQAPDTHNEQKPEPVPEQTPAPEPIPEPEPAPEQVPEPEPAPEQVPEPEPEPEEEREIEDTPPVCPFLAEDDPPQNAPEPAPDEQKRAEEQKEPEPEEQKEAAAVLDGAEGEARQKRPWECEADYIRSLSVRQPVVRRRRVERPRAVQKVAKLREADFFERCRADIDALFASSPKDEELFSLLPDIQWCKVGFDGNTVSVGRTKAFLCYAVAGLYEKSSPLGEEAQWLPKRKNAPTGKGYWLIFQDLATGEIIRCC